MSRFPGVAWALLLDSRPAPRVLVVATQEDGVGLAEASFDLALVGEKAARHDAVHAAVARALAPGGGIVVHGAARRRAVEAAGFTDVRLHAMLRDPAKPKYLVPLDHRGAAGFFFDAVAPRRGLARVASGLSRFGLLGLVAPGRLLMGTKPPVTASGGFLVEPWIRAEAAAIVEPSRARALHFIWITGWKKNATSCTALAFGEDAQSPCFVAKVASLQEAAVLRGNLELLARAFDGESAPPVPSCLHVAERPGAAVVFESVVAGRPVRSADGELAARASRWLLELHRRTGPGPTMLDAATAERLLVQPFERYRARFRPGAEEAAYLDRAATQARALATRPVHLVLAHGDYCPPNLIENGDALGVIDWELPLEPALPAQDLIHFLACLGSYEDVFFSRAGNTRDVLFGYAAQLGIPVASLEILFTIFWLEYAVEKAEMQEKVPLAGEQPWGLARLERGTCVNLERLARAGSEFVLRVG